MKLGKIYELAVKFGIQNDPRSKVEINNELKKIKKEYGRLKGIDKKTFDRERLKNPYSDTRILNGSLNKEIKNIMAGIDIEVSEILLADRLIEKDIDIDLLLTHHPAGRALSNLSLVMHLQKNVLNKLGIKKEIADELMDERIGEVSRGISGRNHTRPVEAAKLLDLAFMCIHTPADNHVSNYLQGRFDKEKPKKAKDALSILKSIPEYRIGMERDAGPVLIAGKEKDDAGKVFVDMTGGTEGSKKIFGRLSQAGVGTIVAMHLSEEHFKNAKSEHINIIIAGHIASDNLGLNLLLDNLSKQGKEEFNVINCSGFVRISRK